MEKELKAYIAPTPDGTGLADYYLKSEADAVIAGLNDEIHNLKRALIIARHEVAKARGKKSYKMKFKGAICDKHL